MSEDTVNISVIVVTYNRDEALRETLNSLLKQTISPLEIIVVDQSSQHDEPTRRFLDELSASGAINYIFQAEPNAQKARNRAIADARGDVLLFVDDDITADEQLIEAHRRNYAENELMAVCGFFTEPGDVAGDQLPPECDDPVTGWIYFPHSYTRRVECSLFPSGNGSIRRELAIQLGGFDENFTYTHFDDTDFSRRLMKLGLKTVHDPSARLFHHKEVRGGKRPGSINDYVIADSNRWYCWFYFFWMNFGWRGRHEIARRMRGCVFRKKNIARPWYLSIAIAHMFAGGARAVVAILHGRRLAFQSPSSEYSILSSRAAETDPTLPRYGTD